MLTDVCESIVAADEAGIGPMLLELGVRRGVVGPDDGVRAPGEVIFLRFFSLPTRDLSRATLATGAA